MLWLKTLRTAYEHSRTDKKYRRYSKHKTNSFQETTQRFAFQLREKKTNKYKKFPINENLKVEIEEFIKDKPDDIPLFYTQKHYRLDRAQAYQIINKAARMVGIKGRIGTHTLRKTFGYHFYQQCDDIVMLQKIFNHSTPSITLRYIGIEQEDIDEVYRNFYL